MTRKIKLTQGQVALVDNEDYEQVNAYKWCAMWSNYTKSFYAGRSINVSYKKYQTVRMHRFILCLKHRDGKEVDHKNHKTLDNRKQNLRIVDRRGNTENQTNQSPFGVGVYKIGNRFRACVRKDNVQFHVGYFDTPAEARKERTKFLKSLLRKET